MDNLRLLLRHNELKVHLDDSIAPPVLEKLKQLSRGAYLKQKELENCDTRNFLNALEDKCHIGVGRYEVLKDLLIKSGFARLVQDIKEAEDEMKEIQILSCHDPSHVEALKKHDDEICSALLEGSTLADVTEILNRNKIIDKQHQKGDPGPEAARELLNHIMNKRDKGLRAMRVLALALRRAGHGELEHNILTTQYSWERGAGRDVHIPVSKWIILNSYLQLTVNLPKKYLHLVLDHLVSKGAVSKDERAAILQQPSREEKVQEMLDTLLSGDREGADDALYNALLLVKEDKLADSMSSTISWYWLKRELRAIYRGRHYETIPDTSLRNKPINTFSGREPPSASLQPPTATHVTTEDRVVLWNVTDSRHGRFLKSIICSQWGNSGFESGQMEWGGYKAVIDIDTVEEVLRSHAMKRGQTVQEILASMPDIPKETLFTLNVTQRPDLKTKWKRLLTGKIFPDAQVLLFEGIDGTDQGIKRGGKKGKLNGCSCELNGEGIEGQSSALNFCPVS